MQSPRVNKKMIRHEPILSYIVDDMAAKITGHLLSSNDSVSFSATFGADKLGKGQSWPPPTE
jgi:stringent starvation protein B